MVSEAKKKKVQELIREINEHPIIGLLNLESLPAQQLQKMRAALKSQGVKIGMARKRLIIRAIQESDKKNLSQLSERITGTPTLIFSRDNPFSLYAFLQKNKSEAAAKPGQKAPRDLVVKAGPTSFAPGPIISELAAVGIKTKVEAGKLTVISDTTIVKEGEVISQKVSDTLKRLDIKPMEIGLNLVALWEDGTVFEAKQLRIDEAEYAQNFTLAAQWAFNLAVECAYPTAETAEVLLQKAFREAKAVALEGNVLNDSTKDELLAKAEAQALAVKEAGSIEAQVEPKKTEGDPYFGHVKEDQTKELFEHMQKGGTLRDVKVKVKE